MNQSNNLSTNEPMHDEENDYSSDEKDLPSLIDSSDFVLSLLKEWKATYLVFKRLSKNSEELFLSGFYNVLADTLVTGRKKAKLLAANGIPVVDENAVLLPYHVDDAEQIPDSQIQMELLLGAGFIPTSHWEIAKKRLGPIIWEFLFHVLIQNEQNKSTVTPYLRNIFAAFDVCICGKLAHHFLNKIEKHLKCVSTETLLYVMHEQSKIGVRGIFRNAMFGYPVSHVFMPRKAFANPQMIRNDEYLLHVIEKYNFVLPPDLEGFVLHDLSVSQNTTKLNVYESFMGKKIPIKLGTINYIPYLVDEIGITDRLALLLLTFTTFLGELRERQRINYHRAEINYAEATTIIFHLFQTLIKSDSIEGAAKDLILEEESKRDNKHSQETFQQLGPLLNICIVLATDCKYSLYDVIIGLEK